MANKFECEKCGKPFSKKSEAEKHERKCKVIFPGKDICVNCKKAADIFSFGRNISEGNVFCSWARRREYNKKQKNSIELSKEKDATIACILGLVIGQLFWWFFLNKILVLWFSLFNVIDYSLIWQIGGSFFVSFMLGSAIYSGFTREKLIGRMAHG